MNEYACTHRRIYVDKSQFDPLLTILYCLECNTELIRWKKYMQYITHADELYAKKTYVFGSPADYSEIDRDNLK